MSTLTLESAIELLKEELTKDSSCTKANLKGLLSYKKYTNAIIKEALEAVIPAQAKATGFKGAYYAFLQEDRRTLAEAEEYIRTNGSKNVVAHLSAHLLVAQLALEVRASLASSKEKDTRSEAHKQAYKLYEEYLAAHESGKVFTRAEANKVHPDKVAQFNDAKLSEMYNEISKIIVVESKRRSRKAA